MKSKRNLRPQVTPKLKQRFSLWYVAAGGIAVAVFIGIGLFLYFNVGTSTNAVADTRSAMQTGNPTGPGGVGGTAGDSNLQLWLNGDSLEVTNDSVTNWYDRSGYQHHFLQNNKIRRPVLQRNVSSLNNQPHLTLDGKGQYLVDEDGEDYVNSRTQYNIFIVSKANNTGTDQGIFDTEEPDDKDDVVSLRYDKDGIDGGQTNVLKGNTGLGDEINHRFETGSQTQSTSPQLITFSWASGEVPSLRFNGATNTLSSGNASTGTTKSSTKFIIGKGSKDNATNGWNGQIAEFIYFDRKLNQAQQIIVENYLSAKYNLPLAANDLYTMDNSASGNYDYDVAGIGRLDANNLHEDAQGGSIVRIKNPLNLEDNEFLFWGHDNQSLSFLEPTDVPSSVENRMERVWGVSEQGEVGAVNVVFDLSALEPLNADDLRLLVDVNKNGSFADETQASDGVIKGATSLGNGRYQFSGVTALEDQRTFTLGSTDPGITTLPVELLYFRAKVTDMETVRLEWKTASEINNDYFTVERSQDGTAWQAVTKIKGAGNATEEQWYTGFDERPHPGTSYFRLKQTDFDGKFTYSEVVAATVEASKLPPIDVQPLTLRTVAPNPFDQSFYVDFELNQAGKVQIQLIGLTGRVVSSTTVEGRQGENRYEFNDQQGLEPGTYLLRMVFGSESGTVRIVKR